MKIHEDVVCVGEGEREDRETRALAFTFNRTSDMKDECSDHATSLLPR